MRPIDADAVAHEILEEYGDVVKSEEVNKAIDKIYGMVINAPTIDIVRCKECIWRDKDNQGEDYCTYAKGLADINESSFCSWGERSEQWTILSKSLWEK